MRGDADQYERCALLVELFECERRKEQLLLRLDGGDEVPEHMQIPEIRRVRAEARVTALERRCDEILEDLWPIGEGVR